MMFAVVMLEEHGAPVARGRAVPELVPGTAKVWAGSALCRGVAPGGLQKQRFWPVKAANH